MNHLFAIEAVRFALVGLLNTVVGLSVIFAAMAFLGWGDVLANMVGYGVGLFVSFSANRKWTFRDRGPWCPSLVRFLLAFGGAYGVNLLVMLLFRDAFHVNSYVAQVAGVLAYTILFFLASRSLVFRSQRTSP